MSESSKDRDVTSEDDVVVFFSTLPAARRREYDALAELDRRFGEDVERQLRERANTPAAKDRS